MKSKRRGKQRARANERRALAGWDAHRVIVPLPKAIAEGEHLPWSYLNVKVFPRSFEFNQESSNMRADERPTAFHMDRSVDVPSAYDRVMPVFAVNTVPLDGG